MTGEKTYYGLETILEDFIAIIFLTGNGGPIDSETKKTRHLLIAYTTLQ